MFGCFWGGGINIATLFLEIVPTLLMRDDNANVGDAVYACFTVTYILMHVQQNLWSKRRPDGAQPPVSR